MPRRSKSAAKERHDQTEHNADDDTGDDGEVEGGVAALDADIAGKTSEPADAEAGPKQETHDHDHAAKEDEHSAEFTHVAR